MFIPDRKIGPNLEKISTGRSVLSGQASVVVTNTAVAISSDDEEIKNGVIVQALSDNSGSVYVGNSSVTTSSGFELQAGQATSIGVYKLSEVYVNGTAGDGVCYIASR